MLARSTCRDLPGDVVSLRARTYGVRSETQQDGNLLGECIHCLTPRVGELGGRLRERRARGTGNKRDSKNMAQDTLGSIPAG